MPNPIATSEVFHAIAEVTGLMHRYTSTKNKKEVERLFVFKGTIDEFSASVSQTGRFEVAGRQVTQNDLFHDVYHDGHPLCAETDHYARLRTERSMVSEFIRGEIKIGYPGPASARNVRPAVDERLTSEADVSTWTHIFEILGFQVEREYEKCRTTMCSTRNFGDYCVELEVDAFAAASANRRKNGLLGGHMFVSVEVPGSNRRAAEEAIDEAVEFLGLAGFRLKEVTGNYEDVYYGRIQV